MVEPEVSDVTSRSSLFEGSEELGRGVSELFDVEVLKM